MIFQSQFSRNFKKSSVANFERKTTKYSKYIKNKNCWLIDNQQFYFQKRFKSGAGGSRTLVQTRNTHAFYMLILLLIVELSKETDTLNSTLSPKFRYAARASASLSWNWWAPRSRTGIRTVHPRDVPFIHLVDELSNDLLFFDQAARA